MLVEATASYRGQDAPPLTLGLRVPLGADARAGAATWLDLVRRAAAWKSSVPSYFFALGSSAPSALIQLGAEAPATVLADLVGATPGDSVCDVVPTGAPARLPAEPPAAVARALAKTGAPFVELLDELSR
jgi:hypothetical protein